MGRNGPLFWDGMSHLFVCQPNFFGSWVTGIYLCNVCNKIYVVNYLILRISMVRKYEKKSNQQEKSAR